MSAEFTPSSDNYLKFIVEELKPFIDSTYSTLIDKENTFIAGSSMGGLISMYAVCEYPNVFGGAACLSTHWPGTFEVENNPIPEIFYNYLTNNLPKPNQNKFVQGFPLKKNNDKIKEVTIIGYGIQSNPTKVVEGYPLKSSKGDQLKEVKIQAYPQSKPTKVVQGYPLSKTQGEPPTPSASPINQDFFYPRSELKHNGTQYIVSKPDLRYIEINGKPVVDKYKFFGVKNTESVKIISQQDAAKMYGEKGKYGAVIIKGADLKYFDIAPGPPPSYTNITLNRNDSFFLKKTQK